MTTEETRKSLAVDPGLGHKVNEPQRAEDPTAVSPRLDPENKDCAEVACKFADSDREAWLVGSEARFELSNRDSQLLICS